MPELLLLLSMRRTTDVCEMAYQARSLRQRERERLLNKQLNYKWIVETTGCGEPKSLSYPVAGCLGMKSSDSQSLGYVDSVKKTHGHSRVVAFRQHM